MATSNPFQGTPDAQEPVFDLPAMDVPSAPPVALEPPKPPKLAKRRSLPIDKGEVVQTTLKRFDQDISDRQDWLEMRLQRYAKYRGWRERKDYPWANSSNAHLPMMITDSQRMQDTLHNAVHAQRPVMTSKALRAEDDHKCNSVDELLDYQIFIEQPGEERIGDLIDSFVNDGQFILFLNWVKDKRTVADIKTIPDLPQVGGPMLLSAIQQEILKAIPGVENAFPTKTEDPYRWRATGMDEGGRPFRATINLFTDESSRTVMEVVRELTIYDGPCWMPKEITDVVVPSRCTNLQPPGPSNPGGAPHVYVVDRPTRDEIMRLYKRGYYDLMTEEDVEKLERPSGQKGQSGMDPDATKLQKDVLEGRTYGNAEVADENFTRIIAFERADVNGDGLEEDVVYWLIKETRTILRARYMTELYPSVPPRRPFAEARFMPVPGQFYAISMLELIEHLYDLVKTIFDQMVDAGTLSVTPWGLYRTGSSMRPEVIKMAAGELYPTSDPARDVAFPQATNPQGMTWALNVLTMLFQLQERETMIGELSLGRVPYGKASALRTASTTETLLQQADARPERILRRFFRGLAEAYQQTHELNMAFLPPKKYYRLSGNPNEVDNPYRVLQDPSQVRGRFQFDFSANILNTNKATHAQVMQTIASTLVNGLTMQTGLVDNMKLYAILRELVRALGEDPNKFMNRPSPQADQPVIGADQAFSYILNGMMPAGRPAEGIQQHLQAFVAFQNQPAFLGLSNTQLQMFQQYVQQLVAQLQQQQMTMENANQFSQQAGQGKPQPGGSMMGATQQPMVQNGELLDETMPGAGGGAASAQA